MQQIGIVNMYDNNYQCRYLINAIISLGYKPVVISSSDTDIIKRSPIQHWIFSGAATEVFADDSTQIPLDVCSHKSKKVLLICYSMESLLWQLGVPIITRDSNRKELFRLAQPDMPLFNNIKNPMVLRRNHVRFVTANKAVNNIAAYEGELMIATYKNATLMQFHPEKTPDGKKLLLNWITQAA